MKFGKKYSRMTPLERLLSGRPGIHMKDPDSGDGGGNNGGDNNDAGNDDQPGGKNKGPSEAEAKLLKENMKYKQKNQKLQDQVNDLSSNIDSLNESQQQLSSIMELLGDDGVDGLKNMIQAKADEETAKLEAKGEYETIIEGLKTSHQSILDQIQGEHQKVTETMSSELEEARSGLTGAQRQIEELTVGRSFSDSEYVRERSMLTPSIARNEFGSHFEFVDGQVVGFDKPKGVEGRAQLVDGEGNPKGFEAAIEHLYANHPDSKSIIKTQQKPGAGSKSSQDQGGKPAGSEEKLSGVSKISAALSARRG